MSSLSHISVVVPIYNEAGNIPLLVEKLEAALSGYTFEIVLVDDGSSDTSLSVIQSLSQQKSHIRYLAFTRNFGHQAALKAGLEHAKGDCVISLDGDLEHPPELIPELIAGWKEGYEVVITLRKEKKGSYSLFKSITSNLFYRLMNLLSEVKIEKGSADFRLLDRKVVDVLVQMPENPIFLRAIINWLGFSQKAIYYEADNRYVGSSKYTASKMFSFGLEGITSFSVKPLKISSFVGTIIAGLSAIYGFYAIYIKLFTDRSIDGWASLLALVAFMGSMQMIMIGILGEYLGRLFIASKSRPQYIIKETNETAVFTNYQDKQGA